MVEVETFDKAAHAKEYTTVHEYNPGVLFDSSRIVAEAPVCEKTTAL